VRRTVVLSPAVQADLASLFDYIAEQASSAVALRYVQRIYDYCGSFDVAAERGTKRDDLRSGLRTVGFERRVTIAFHVEPETVTIDRVLYGGRDVDSILGDDE
jgi:toxin ParE1/3/4